MTTWTEIGILWATAIVCLLLGRLGARMDARQDRADLARLRADLAAITARTMARTKARSDASRRGWATRKVRTTGNPDPVCADCGGDLDGEGGCKQGCHIEAVMAPGAASDMVCQEGRLKAAL